jgi:hypothetical protein
MVLISIVERLLLKHIVPSTYNGKVFC